MKRLWTSKLQNGDLLFFLDDSTIMRKLVSRPQREHHDGWWRWSEDSKSLMIKDAEPDIVGNEWDKAIDTIQDDYYAYLASLIVK